MLPLFDAGVPSPMWRGWLRKRERPSSLRSSFLREARGKPWLSERWTCCLSWTTREFSISMTPLRRRTWWCSSQSCILSEQFHFLWNIVSSRDLFYHLTQNCRSSLSQKGTFPPVLFQVLSASLLNKSALKCISRTLKIQIINPAVPWRHEWSTARLFPSDSSPMSGISKR